MDNVIKPEEVKSWTIDLDKVNTIEDIKVVLSVLNITLTMTESQYEAAITEEQRAYFKENGNPTDQGS